MHVHSPIFQGQLIEKKYTNNFNDLGAREGWKKCLKKGKKLRKKSVLNKSQSVTHVSTCIFKGLFKNIVFRSVALVTKKVMDYFRFFSQKGLFSALYPTI